MTEQCSFCRFSYKYSSALYTHIISKHQDQADAFFNQSLTDSQDSVEDGIEESLWGEDSNKSHNSDYNSDEEPATPSDIEDEDEDEDENTVVKTFASQKYLPDAGESAGDIPHHHEAMNSLLQTPFFLFDTAHDFHLAKWFIDSNTSKSRIEEYFKKGLHLGAGSYGSAYTLYRLIEQLPTTLGEPSWSFMEGDIDGEAFVFCHRDPMVCIRYLLAQTAYSEEMVYAPIKEFNSAGERMYSELHTADWWWNLQATLPVGSTLVPVLCSSDQTPLTNFSGDKKAWPIYLTIGNIKSATRNKPSAMAMILLAMLPIPPKVGKLKLKAAEAQRARSRAILDLVMERTLSALYEPALNGVRLECADGQLQFCFPVVCGWLADHLEHVTLQHLKNNACPVCEVDASSLGQPPTLPFPTRNHDSYKARVEHYQERGDIKDLDWLQERGIKAPLNSFWRLPRVRPEDKWKPDILHTIYLGLLKHLMEWIQGFLGKYNRLDDFDRVWKAIPPYTGITIHKRTYREVTQWQSKEMRNLGRFLLVSLTIALRKPTALQRSAFTRALKCTQALIDFHLMAQYHSHTDQTLKYMNGYLASFHDHKDIFLEFRTSKPTKAKAKQADRELRMNQTGPAPTSQNTAKKRKVTAENRLRRETQQQVIYRQGSHFNFIKMHLLTHFTAHVRLYGNIPAYSTEVGESSHREQIKIGYRSLNKIEATKQILQHYSRHHTMAMLVVAIREAARRRPADNLTEDVIDLLDKEKTPAWHMKEVISQVKPSRLLRSRINTRVTNCLKDVMLDIGDTECQLLQKILLYSKRSLPDSRKLATDHNKLKLYPAEQFSQLQVPTLRFQETDIYTIHHLRCTINTPFRGGVVRNDWVWVRAGGSTEFGVLRERLPGKLKCLFKIRDPIRHDIHRLALVQMLRVEDARLLEADSSLLRVGLRKVKRLGNDEWVVSIASIIGMAHLVQDKEEGY